MPYNRRSQKAQSYAENFAKQSKQYRYTTIKDRVLLIAWIYYKDWRSDLDDTLLCDCLQESGYIKNDRQIVRKMIDRRIDKQHPRVEFILIRVKGGD